MPEPLALEMIAGVVGDHEVRILDMRIDSNLRGVIEEFAPEIVGVTALTTEVYTAREVLKEIKQFSEEIFTVVGGHHVTLLPEDFYLPEVDAIVLGEGERVFPKVVEAVRSGRKLAQVPSLIWRGRDGGFVRNTRLASDLGMDELPLPRRDLTEQYRDEYFFLFDKPDTSVATSRGCPYRCSFCSVWEFFQGRVSQMSPPRVIEEILAAHSEHITFVDDNFLLNSKREHAIADLIKSEGIRKRYSMQARTDSIVRRPELLEKWVDVGLYAMLLGLEGAGDDMLKSINKNNSAKTNDEAIRILQDNGVIIWGCFIADPNWTSDDFKRLRDYVSEKEITHTQFTVLTPLPGTDLYRQQYDQLLTRDYRCYDALHAVVPTRLPRERFYQHFANLYRQNDLGPYYDLVREGKLTIENVRMGKEMLETMSKWESYLEYDPVLGKGLEIAEGTYGTSQTTAPQQQALDG